MSKSYNYGIRGQANRTFVKDFEGNRALVARKSFTNPIEWRAAQELIRRGLWKVIDSKKHWFWEWKAIERV